MKAILKKELKSYFLSPIGYVVIGIFLLCFSVFFYLTALSSGSVDLGGLYYYTALYGLIIIVPVLFSINNINIYSSSANNENVCRRKKKWNRAITFNITN